MYKPHSLNLIGIVLFFFFIIYVQIIWIFDPIRVNQHTYWIDLMDVVLHLAVIIPALWLISSCITLYHRRNHLRTGLKVYMLLYFLYRFLIIGFSIASIYFIIFEPHRLLFLAMSMAITFILVLCDRFVDQLVTYKRTTWKNLCLFGFFIAFSVILIFPTSYTVTYPGLTVNMNKYAHVVGSEPKGEIFGVLIFERPAFPIDWVYAQLFPHYDLNKRRVTDRPLTEQLQRVRTMKLDANKLASAVAFQKVGIGQGIMSRGAVITEVISGTPAAEQLQVGDIIISIDDQTVSSVEDFRQYMLNTKPGVNIHLKIIRSAEEMVFLTRTYDHPEDMSRAILGASLIDNIYFDIPQEVLYHSYLLHEGGPSHGAILTLALINQLTPQGVTNGNVVAGTGTIRVDGSIGPIGGIRQKAYSVERAGADVFFVPEGQYEEARKGAKELNIVPVRTLSDILIWLEENPKES